MSQSIDRASRESSPGLSVEGFSDIVGAIYECVFDPTLWPGALDGIRAAAGARFVWIAVHYPRQVRSVYEIEVGTDPEWQRRLRETFVPMSPFISVPHHATPGLVVSVADVVDYDEFTNGRFYLEWSAPQGLHDFIMAVLAVEAGRMDWLGVGLDHRATRDDKARVAAFRPHVERALRISDLLEAKGAEAADLSAALDSLAAGAILVDAALKVRGMNAAAERLAGAGAGLFVRDGRLHCAGADETELGAAVRAAADGRLESAGATLLLDDGSGSLGLVMHLLPLIRPRQGSAGEAVAAIFLTNPAAPVRTPMRALVKRYGLTPAETRVLGALVEGKSPGAIAAIQGTSVATVRTHLARLYEKTGSAGQGEIVRLVKSMAA